MKQTLNPKDHSQFAIRATVQLCANFFNQKVIAADYFHESVNEITPMFVDVNCVHAKSLNVKALNETVCLEFLTTS